MSGTSLQQIKQLQQQGGGNGAMVNAVDDMVEQLKQGNQPMAVPPPGTQQAPPSHGAPAAPAPAQMMPPMQQMSNQVAGNPLLTQPPVTIQPHMIGTQSSMAMGPGGGQGGVGFPGMGQHPGIPVSSPQDSSPPIANNQASVTHSLSPMVLAVLGVSVFVLFILCQGLFWNKGLSLMHASLVSSLGHVSFAGKCLKSLILALVYTLIIWASTKYLSPL
mgnify:CR=1 FL=1